METIEPQFESFYTNFQTACEKAGTSPDEITIIAVTKGFSTDAIRCAFNKDIQDIGENRVKETLKKKQELPEQGSSARWHMVGHLQSNKVKRCLGEFDLIHSIDRKSVIEEFNKRLGSESDRQHVLMQVNVSGEESKGGVDPNQASKLLDRILKSPCLTIRGLMTMAPYTDNKKVLNSTFEKCRKLRDELEQEKNIDLPELSMGMTNDFPQAIRHGASMIRIGRGLFGERPET